MQAKEVKEIRESLGLTQEKFAQLLNVTTGTINRWEKGVSKPSPLAIEKIESCMKKKRA